MVAGVALAFLPSFGSGTGYQELTDATQVTPARPGVARSKDSGAAR
jgi:hypothetical protein